MSAVRTCFSVQRHGLYATYEVKLEFVFRPKESREGNSSWSTPYASEDRVFFKLKIFRNEEFRSNKKYIIDENTLRIFAGGS